MRQDFAKEREDEKYKERRRDSVPSLACSSIPDASCVSKSLKSSWRATSTALILFDNKELFSSESIFFRGSGEVDDKENDDEEVEEGLSATQALTASDAHVLLSKSSDDNGNCRTRYSPIPSIFPVNGA